MRLVSGLGISYFPRVCCKSHLPFPMIYGEVQNDLTLKVNVELATAFTGLGLNLYCVILWLPLPSFKWSIDLSRMWEIESFSVIYGGTLWDLWYPDISAICVPFNDSRFQNPMPWPKSSGKVWMLSKFVRAISPVTSLSLQLLNISPWSWFIHFRGSICVWVCPFFLKFGLFRYYSGVVHDPCNSNANDLVFLVLFASELFQDVKQFGALPLTCSSA